MFGVILYSAASLGSSQGSSLFSTVFLVIFITKMWSSCQEQQSAQLAEWWSSPAPGSRLHNNETQGAHGGPGHTWNLSTSVRSPGPSWLWEVVQPPTVPSALNHQSLGAVRWRRRRRRRPQPRTLMDGNKDKHLQRCQKHTDHCWTNRSREWHVSFQRWFLFSLLH